MHPFLTGIDLCLRELSDEGHEDANSYDRVQYREDFRDICRRVKITVTDRGKGDDTEVCGIDDRPSFYAPIKNGSTS